jgi:hypothetical protein
MPDDDNGSPDGNVMYAVRISSALSLRIDELARLIPWAQKPVRGRTAGRPWVIRVLASTVSDSEFQQFVSRYASNQTPTAGGVVQQSADILNSGGTTECPTTGSTSKTTCTG